MSSRLTYLQGLPDPLEGVPAPVKAALTKAYKQREAERKVKSSDLLPPPPGQKRAKKPLKRLAVEEVGLVEEEVAERDGGLLLPSLLLAVVVLGRAGRSAGL